MTLATSTILIKPSEAFLRYKIVNPGVGGYGQIQVLVDAAGFPPRTIDIRVG